MVLLAIPAIIIVAALGFFYAGDLFQNFSPELPSFNLNKQQKTAAPPSASGPNTNPPSTIQTPSPQPSDTSPSDQHIDSTTSPFAKKVFISKVTAPRSNRTSLVTIKANLSASEEVSITNWRIDTVEERYTIPKGSPEFSQQNNIKSDIVLTNGTIVYISGARNPIANNANYRVNQCLREFEDGRKFPLSVPGNCTKVPKPTLREISNLSISCQDYILKNTGRSCTFPQFDQERAVTVDVDCFFYLTELEKRYKETSTYEYCYQQHSADPDFFRNLWHIYTEGVEFLRESRDHLILYDDQGRFVHEYFY
jgi:hypothetical protein